MVLVFKKVHIYTTSLVLCFLGLHLLVQGVYVQSLVRELRFHMPCGQETKTGNSNLVSVTTYGVGWGGRWEGGSRGRGYIFTYG